MDFSCSSVSPYGHNLLEPVLSGGDHRRKGASFRAQAPAWGIHADAVKNMPMCRHHNGADVAMCTAILCAMNLDKVRRPIDKSSPVQHNPSQRPKESRDRPIYRLRRLLAASAEIYDRNGVEHRPSGLRCADPAHINCRTLPNSIARRIDLWARLGASSEHQRG